MGRGKICCELDGGGVVGGFGDEGSGSGSGIESENGSGVLMMMVVVVLVRGESVSWFDGGGFRSMGMVSVVCCRCGERFVVGGREKGV